MSQSRQQSMSQHINGLFPRSNTTRVPTPITNCSLIHPTKAQTTNTISGKGRGQKQRQVKAKTQRMCVETRCRDRAIRTEGRREEGTEGVARREGQRARGRRPRRRLSHRRGGYAHCLYRARSDHDNIAPIQRAQPRAHLHPNAFAQTAYAPNRGGAHTTCVKWQMDRSNRSTRSTSSHDITDARTHTHVRARTPTHARPHTYARARDRPFG